MYDNTAAVIRESSIDRDKIPLMNTFIDNVTMAETIQIAENALTNGKAIYQISINANKMNLIKKDPRFRNIVNTCALCNADGASILWTARLFGYQFKERVAGCDLFQNLIKLAAEKGYRVYFLGAKEDTLRTMVKNLKEKYPSIVIAGCRNGYFTKEDEPAIVRKIASSNADLLFAALSSPKQEFFLHDHWERLNVRYAMGVGGSFDVVAGTVKRAPKWMIACNLEWLYRFIKEPRKRFYSCIVSPAKYMFSVLQARFF